MNNCIVGAINTTNLKENSDKQQYWISDETLNLVEDQKS